jgi:hypothetical protein
MGLQRRRLIFFCSCEHPGFCHRHVVARLLLRAASSRVVKLQIAEWPGGEPAASPIQAPLARAGTSDRTRLPLLSARGLARLAALPYGSLVSRAEFSDIVPVGPVRYVTGRWYLPVLKNDEGSAVGGTLLAVRHWRKRHGYSGKHSN